MECLFGPGVIDPALAGLISQNYFFSACFTSYLGEKVQGSEFKGSEVQRLRVQRFKVTNLIIQICCES